MTTASFQQIVHTIPIQPGIYKYYNEEHSFIDATLGTITLTYTAKNDKVQIRKTDILLNQENTGVRTIYVEKIIPGSDSSVIKKMLWIANLNCQITTLIQKEGQPEAVILERYVWDDRH